MGWGCFVGLHRWSGWQRHGEGVLGFGHDPHWARECLDCGERERRQRPPSDLCDDEDHEWEGSLLRPLKREAVDREGEPRIQSYKRCQRCPAEQVFSTSESWEDEDDG